MAQRYAIADWLTAAQKARAVAGRYLPDGERLRTRRGYCPRGRALWHPLRVPDPHEVATVLTAKDEGERALDRWYAISAAAGDFMDDWDRGRIAPADLPTALGYAPDAPEPAQRA